MLLNGVEVESETEPTCSSDTHPYFINSSTVRLAGSFMRGKFNWNYMRTNTGHVDVSDCRFTG